MYRFLQIAFIVCTLCLIGACKSISKRQACDLSQNPTCSICDSVHGDPSEEEASRWADILSKCGTSLNEVIEKCEELQDECPIGGAQNGTQQSIVNDVIDIVRDLDDEEYEILFNAFFGA